MSIDYGDPPSDFIRDCAEDVVLCKAEMFTPADSCACEIPCCTTCGGSQVVVGNERECPLCDRIPSSNKPAALFEAAEHPAFTGTWMGRVSTAVADCKFDGCVEHTVEEVTERIEPETMAQAVSR